jgi:hypothetical protein
VTGNYTGRAVGDWYTIGVALGAGVALGILAGALLAWIKLGWALSTAVAAGVGVVAGLVVNRWMGPDWVAPVAAVAGGVVGAVSASIVVRGTLRRGGTVGGTAFILGSLALVVFLLALVPAVGYVLAVAVPLAAARRGSGPDRHAGLRSLAK